VSTPRAIPEMMGTSPFSKLVSNALIRSNSEITYSAGFGISQADTTPGFLKIPTATRIVHLIIFSEKESESIREFGIKKLAMEILSYPKKNDHR